MVCGREHIKLQCPRILAPLRKKRPVYWTSAELEGVNSKTEPSLFTDGRNMLLLYSEGKSDIRGLAFDEQDLEIV